MSDNESHELRTLRRQVRLLGRQLGNAGATIYTLRCEVAALRRCLDKQARGHYTQLERDNASLTAELRKVYEQRNSLLKENSDLAKELERAQRPLVPAAGGPNFIDSFDAD